MLETEVETWAEYLEEYEKDAISEALQGYPNDTRGLEIDFKQLSSANPELAQATVDSPETMLENAEEALPHTKLPHTEDLEGINIRVGPIHTQEIGVSQLRATHQGELVTIRAQVSKVTDVRPKYEKAAFECQRCHTITKIPVVSDEVSVPNECQGTCDRGGPFLPDEEESEMYDHQIVELQPRPDEDAMNLQRSLRLDLKHDLVDSVEAGDRVKATGIVKTEALAGGKKMDARRPPYLEGLSIQKEQQDFESYDTDRVDEIEELAQRDDLTDALINSFAPNILTGERGDTHKLAIIYQLFSGVSHELSGGGTLRGDINILLIGAPGVGKSQYLGQANELAPKSVKASGKGATAAGLTATATQPEFGDGWMLDAGALVMADGGLACIDEFDKMRDDARKSMHEAMEDQEIPINKAGINTTLRSRTSVLAAANPEGGSFNRYDALSEQINLGEALITRFDLVFALTDNPDAEKDRQIATHQYNVTNEGSVQPEIEPELLREYIAYARQNVYPSFENDETVEMLVDKYVDIRQDNGEDEDAAVPVTARMNDSLRRLSQAAARAELSDTVEPRHAERAIEQYQMTIGDIGLDEDGNPDANKMAGNKSKSQQERVEWVEDTIQELSNKESGADIGELRERASDAGIDERKLDAHIQGLLDKGTVYEPEMDTYRVV